MWYQPGFGALQKQFEIIIVLGNVRHDHLNLRRYITYVILYNNRIDILFMMFAEYSQKNFTGRTIVKFHCVTLLNINRMPFKKNFPIFHSCLICYLMLSIRNIYVTLSSWKYVSYKIYLARFITQDFWWIQFCEYW